MPVYHAGTGEGYDFELFLLTLIVGLALLVLLSWGIPWFRNRLQQRREERLLADQQQSEPPEEPDPTSNTFTGVPTH